MKNQKNIEILIKPIAELLEDRVNDMLYLAYQEGYRSAIRLGEHAKDIQDIPIIKKDVKS